MIEWGQKSKPKNILKASYNPHRPPPPKSLNEKITPKNSHVEFPSLRWNNNCQHCCANHVACCCVLVAVVCKRCNNSQQHAATCNRVSKRTQHVTSCKTLGVVSTWWSAMLRPFALCTGLSKWQAINSLPESRGVRTSSRKRNTCGSILVSEPLYSLLGWSLTGSSNQYLCAIIGDETKSWGQVHIQGYTIQWFKKITWARPKVNWFIVQ